MKVCLDVSLLSKTENEDFLSDCTKYRDGLPNTVYVQGYENSSYQTICDYEEDNIINRGTLENSIILGSNLIWQEMYTYFTDIDDDAYGDRGSYAVRLNWNETQKAQYEINLYETALNSSEYSYLQFDVMDLMDSAVNDGVEQPADFTIVVKREDGEEERFRLSEYQTVYPPIRVRLSKLDYLFSKNVYKHQFQTVRIPLKQDRKRIIHIQFKFDQSNKGVIMLDNIGLSN